MKSIIEYNVLKRIFLLLLVATLTISCFGDDDAEITNEDVPELILKVTNCNIEDIQINEEVNVLGGPGRWFVEVKVKITCMGEVVDEAELKVKYGWVELARKIETNDQGEATTKQRVTSSTRPTGKVTITIEGSDGSMPVEVEF